MTQANDSNQQHDDPTFSSEPQSGKLKIVFAPGCFDNFEGTQEELQELIAELHRMAQTGELFAKAEPLSDEDYARITTGQGNTRQ